MAGRQFSIWEGIYGSFGEARQALRPSNDEPMRQQIWLGKCHDRLKAALDRFSQSTSPNPLSEDHQYLLAAAVAVMAGFKSDLRILDVGGGPAVTFYEVAARCPDIGSMTFDIVEFAELIALVEPMLPAQPRPNFLTAIPEPGAGQYDIVHFGTSLQYFEDWRETLQTCAALQPQLFIFDDLLGGTVPSFVVLQNYYDHQTPSHILNIEDVRNAMADLGYRQRYLSRHIAQYLGSTDRVPMDNYPPSHRIERPVNLVFTRQDKIS